MGYLELPRRLVEACLVGQQQRQLGEEGLSVGQQEGLGPHRQHQALAACVERHRLALATWAWEPAALGFLADRNQA